jgi:esterase/lipase superfamily enzyme
MGDAGTIFAIGLALGLLVLLGVPAWRSISGASAWVRTLALFGIAAAAVAIIAISLTMRDVSREAAPPPSASAPPSPAPGGTLSQAPAPEAPVSMPDNAPAPPPVGAAPPSEEAAGGEAPATDDNENGGSRGLGSPPPPPPAPAPVVGAPKAEAPQGEWDVVPVYYGTDRGRADQPTRADYGNERGRRLELGRALVTVPRSHTVPQIERPWSVRIPYFDIVIGETEDPNTHFTMKEVKPLTRDEFLELVRARIAASERYKKHALIFVHGFNTTFDFAMYRTAQIAYDLKFDGAPFAYSWPSGGGLSSYTFDRERSGQSIKFLKEYIELVLDQTGAEAVSVVAHSMGNQPMLQVLKDLKAARPNGLVFNQIILAAPDVDRDSFADIANEIQGLAKNITLYASENDTALAASRQVNGGSRAGDIPESGPLVLQGVDTLDVTSVSTDSLGINHSGYAENNKLLKDIESLVSTGAAPSTRLPALEVVPLGDGKYWRFPKVMPAAPQ